MKNLKLFLVLILSLVYLISCTEVEIDLTGSIRGTVIDTTTEEPLSGATVTLSPSGLSVTTGSTGAYEFQNIESGSYTISVSKSTYNSDTKSVSVIPGDASVVDFAILTGNGSLELSTSLLDFGAANVSLAFDIENIGKNEFDYVIDCSSYDWLSATPSTGSISASRTTSITVKVDRSLITESKSIILPITSDAGSANITINVTLDVNAPILSTTTTSIDFGEYDVTAVMKIENTGKSELTYDFATISQKWLSVSSTSGAIAVGEYQYITFEVDRTLLSQSETTTVFLFSNGGDMEIPVSVTYVKSAPIMYVEYDNASRLEFNGTEYVKTFIIGNEGNSSLTYEIEDCDWATFVPASGSVSAGSTQTVTVTIDRSKIDYGSSDFAYATPKITTNANESIVSIYVEKPTLIGVLSVSKSTLDFGENYDQLTFNIANTGTASFDYSLQGDYSWLSVSSSTGTVDAGSTKVITIYIDRSKFYGDASGTLTVSTDVGTHAITISAYEPIDYGTVTSPYQDLSIVVTNVYLSGTTLYLEYKATYSSGQTGSFVCYGSGLANDDEGNIFNSSNIQVSLGGSGYSYSASISDIISGSVFKGGISISDIDVNATKFTSIILRNSYKNSSSGSSKSEDIVFYNVPIIR